MKKNNDAVHALGNGRLCVYGREADLIQVFGPPYSAPSFASFALMVEPGVEVWSSREPGAAIWTHEVRRDGAAFATITDFVDAQLPCLVRRVECARPLPFAMALHPEFTAIVNTGRFPKESVASALLCHAGQGVAVYNDYPTPWAIHHQVLALGKAALDVSGDGARVLTHQPGVSWLFITGGPAYPDCVVNAEAALAVGYDVLLARTREHWRAFTAPTSALAAKLPAIPATALTMEAADDTVTMIRAQQAVSGSVLAGYNYHLGYVRDQYGVFRGLLALGQPEAAAHILDFYADRFRVHGRIYNAFGIGVDSIIHRHENDDVEITGYLILQAMDLFRATGDEDRVRAMMPMLEWCWKAQTENFIGGMLPFNGDETYVAGGILPRQCLLDGSAEATLLFITGGAKFLGWVAERGLWDAGKLDKARATLDGVQGQWRANFWRGDKGILTNNLSRSEQPALMPRFRHGVCEAMIQPFYFGWTERTDTGRYVRPSVLAGAGLPAAPREEFYLRCVGLMPKYTGADLLSEDEMAGLTGAIIRDYEATGQLPSAPGGNICTGYDYGLLLWSLAQHKHPAAPKIFERMMSLRDATGVWVEYYRDGVPAGTRCRPWESGINIEAALAYCAMG